MSVAIAIDTLRGRFARLRVDIPLDTLVPEVGVAGTVLRRFVRGEPVRQQSLEAIERWCDQRERTHNAHNQ